MSTLATSPAGFAPQATEGVLRPVEREIARDDPVSRCDVQLAALLPSPSSETARSAGPTLYGFGERSRTVKP